MSDGKYLNVGDPVATAKRLVERQRLMYRMSSPEVMFNGAILGWRGDSYVGSIQIAYPDYSKEVVFLNKSTKPVPQSLLDEIRKIDGKVYELVADDSVDLDGRDHILRMVGDRLTRMTPEQSLYAVNNPLDNTVEAQFL